MRAEKPIGLEVVTAKYIQLQLCKKKTQKKSLTVFPSLLSLLLLFDSSFPDHAHSPSEAPPPLSLCVKKDPPRCSASSLVQYYHVLFYFSKEGRKEGRREPSEVERLRVSHGSHVFVD